MFVDIQNARSGNIEEYHRLRDSSEKYSRNNPDKALLYANEALALAQSLKNSDILVESYLKTGILYRINGNLPLSEKHLSKALELGKDNEFYPVILKEKGITLKQRYQFKEALTLYLEALHLFRKKNRKSEVAVMYNNIGRLYFAMNDFEKAVEYYRMSLRMKDVDEDILSRAIAFHNIGSVNEKKKEKDSALYFYRKALSIYIKENDPILIAYGYASIGKMLGVSDSAGFFLEKSLEIRQQLKLSADITESLHFLAGYRMLRNENDEAIRLYSEVYSRASGFNNHMYAFESAGALAELYRLRNDFARADFYQRNAVSWKDSLYVQEKMVKELGFDFRMKELRQKKNMEELKRINRLKELELKTSQSALENEEQKTIYWITVLLLTVVLTSFSVYFFIRQKKKNAELLESNRMIELKNKENEILVKEVHHRVKNNLHTVLSMLRMEKRRMKNLNADLLAENLEKRLLDISMIHEILYNQNDLVSIELKKYLNTIGNRILGLYSGKQIILKTEGNAKTDADKALYIGHLFSELFTNSCKHAFTDVPEPMVLLIICQNENELSITYSDNGKGFKKEEGKISFGRKLIESHGKKLQAQINEFTDNAYRFELKMKNG